MDTLRDPSAAPPPPRTSRRSKWLLAALMVFVGLAAGGACGLCGIALLARSMPGFGRQAAGPTLWPVAATSRTPAPTPEPLTNTPSPELAEAPPYAYYAVDSYPGPPGELRTVTLPPAETDRNKLDEAQRLYERGMAAFDAGEWEEAIAAFDKALELDPRHWEAYNFRGAAYRRIGDTHTELDIYLEYYDLSIADYTRAIAAAPSSWRPLNNRGGIYSARAGVEPLRADRRKWVELALSDHEQATRLDATQAWSWLNLGSEHVGLGQCDQALEELQKSQPWTTRTLSTVAAAYRCKGSYQDALNVIEDAIAADPGDPALYVERSTIYRESGEYAKALESAMVAAAKSSAPFVPGWITYEQAAAEYYLGHYDRAEEAILVARRFTWIDWGEPYYYLGMIYLKQGKTQQAIEALEWAEQTLDEGSKLLPAARAELQKLKQ